jgi:hypothetical protein
MYLSKIQLNYHLRNIPTPPSRYPFSHFIDLISSTPWVLLGQWATELHSQIIRFQFGTYTYIVISSPDMINHIMMNISRYPKDLAAMKPFLVLLGNGLVTSRDRGDDDRTWSSQRKLITPVLRSDVLDQTAEISIKATDRLIEKLIYQKDKDLTLSDSYRIIIYLSRSLFTYC